MLYNTIYRDSRVIYKTLIRLVIRLIINKKIKKEIFFTKTNKFKLRFFSKSMLTKLNSLMFLNILSEKAKILL